MILIDTTPLVALCDARDSKHRTSVRHLESLAALRKAQTLRRRGVALSDVVREAIDKRFSELRSTSPVDIKAVIRRTFEQYPDPSGLAPRDYDVHDRHIAREAVLRKLRPVRP